MASEIVAIISVFLFFGLLFACMLVSFLREQAALKKRMQRANERRAHNEMLAENIRVAFAEQIRDNSPVSVPITPQERQNRRRILHVEKK